MRKIVVNTTSYSMTHRSAGCAQARDTAARRGFPAPAGWGLQVEQKLEYKQGLRGAKPPLALLKNLYLSIALKGDS